MARKTASKAAKKTARPAAAPAKKSAKASAADKVRSKSEVYRTIAEHTDLKPAQVKSVFEAMTTLMAADLSKKGPGMFNVPGLMRVTVQHKPATKATTRPNPFRPGEMMEVKAKPARTVVKVRPLKGLKSLV